MAHFQDTGSDRNKSRDITAQSVQPDLLAAQSLGSDNQDLSQLKNPNVSLRGIASLPAQEEQRPQPWGGPRLVDTIVQSWANREYGCAVIGSLSGGLPIAGSYIGRTVSDFGLLCAALGIEAFRNTAIPLLGNPEHTVHANLILWSIGSVLAVAGATTYLAGKSVQLPCDVCAAAIDGLMALTIR